MRPQGGFPIKSIILGDLSKAIYAIHKVGPVAWVLCATAIGTAAGIKLFAAGAAAAGGTAAATGTTLTFASAPLAPVMAAGALAGGAAAASAVAILGANAFGIAVSIAVASGGIGALSLIRNSYRIKTKESNKLILVRI